jgi:hypothetical protein
VHVVEERAGPASPLERLRAAVVVVDERRAQDEAVLGHFVAVQLLDDLGASAQAVRRQLADMLGVDVERLSCTRRRRVLPLTLKRPA